MGLEIQAGFRFCVGAALLHAKHGTRRPGIRSQKRKTWRPRADGLTGGFVTKGISKRGFCQGRVSCGNLGWSR